tara:strand:- start:8230 stop:9132 length:903 start_codon:yes stop_codon:yes gene_type:complete
MPLEASDFSPFTSNGITISRDPRSRTELLRLANSRLSGQRYGSELDDHLSDDIYCQRRSVLKKLRQFRTVTDNPPTDRYHPNNPPLTSRYWGIKYDPKTLESSFDSNMTIMFGFGYALQDFVFGEHSEVPVWDNKEQLWYSPDGLGLLDRADLHEFKTTRTSPRKKADRELGKSVEEVIFDNNPAWFKYMLAAMYMCRTNEYYLSVAWVIPGEFETFKISVTDQAIQSNWKYLSDRRKLRRDKLSTWIEEITPTGFRIKEKAELPEVSTRSGEWECRNCEFFAREPCISEVPAQNLMERG